MLCLLDQKLPKIVYLLAQHQEKLHWKSTSVVSDVFTACVCVCTCAFLCQKPLRAICFPPCSVSLGAYHLHVASTALRSKPPKSDKPVCTAHANESESLTCAPFISHPSPLAQSNSCCITQGLSDGPVVFSSPCSDVKIYSLFPTAHNSPWKKQTPELNIWDVTARANIAIKEPQKQQKKSDFFFFLLPFCCQVLSSACNGDVQFCCKPTDDETIAWHVKELISLVSGNGKLKAHVFCALSLYRSK